MFNIRKRLKKKYTNITKSFVKQICNAVARRSNINLKSATDYEQQSVSSDKLSWSVGTKVLVHSYQNNRSYECIIHKISKSISSTSDGPNDSDLITVIFKNGEIKTFNRSDYEIQSHSILLTNRHKLTRYCTIDRYSISRNEWIADYIDKYKKSTNGNCFSVNGQNYHRWSHKIRCSPLLLELQKDSMIFIFDADIDAWCYGKIVAVLNHEIYKNNLNIFRIHYQKNGKIYLKYVHEFSASVAVIDNSIYTEYRMNENDINLKTATMIDFGTADLTYYALLLQGLCRKGLKQNEDPFINNDVVSILVQYIGHLYELDIYMNDEDIQSATIIDSDKTDAKYYEFLLQGMRRDGLKHDEDVVFINKDVLNILIKYIGWKYELVMAIESKTWSLAIKHKEKNMTPKYSTVHDGRYLPLYDLNSNDISTSFEYLTNTNTVSNTPKNDTFDIIEDDGFVFLDEELSDNNLEINILHQNAHLFDSFVSIKTHNDNNIASKNKNRNEHNPYIPHKLTNSAKECIKENIFDVFHYMLTMNALQFIEDEKKQNDTKIFNYNLHDKNTGNILYGMAKREDIRNYKWNMLNKLFSAEQILNEWNIPQCKLPQIASFQIADKERIYSLLMNRDKFKQIFDNTDWCTIKVFNRVNHNDGMVFKAKKKEFVAECIEFMNKENDINLISILMVNEKTNTAEIEYLYVVSIPIKHEIIDIGISFKYDTYNTYNTYNKNANITVSGLHINKAYIINQHQLADPQCQCKYLINFRSNIDDISIK